MQQRVACLSCGAHRDRALPGTAVCFVCGGTGTAPVYPNLSDLDVAISEASAHLLDLLQLRAELTGAPAAITH